MTETEANPSSGETGSTPQQPPLRSLAQVPGVIAISFYLVLLAVTNVLIVVGVIKVANYPQFFLLFSALLFAASAGLMLLFRWAWAMALSAVFLLAGYSLWTFSRQYQPSALILGLLNLILFLYLIRPEVREKLR